MEVTRQNFNRLDAVIDELHALFELWERERPAPRWFSPFGEGRESGTSAV